MQKDSSVSLAQVWINLPKLEGKLQDILTKVFLRPGRVPVLFYSNIKSGDGFFLQATASDRSTLKSYFFSGPH